MNHLTGTGALLRLIVRRDRVRLPIWFASIAGLTYAQVVSIQGLYPDPADLAAAGRIVEGNAAFIAMAGPPLALDTIGGRTTFEISAFAMVLAALMSMFLVTRHLRGDEEAGRTELVRSTVVGRHAPLAATLLAATGANAVLGALVLVALVGPGLGVAGSAALAVGIASVGLVFAATAAVTSQITSGTRTASGLAGALLAVAFVLRAIGDVGDGSLSWASPLGWAQALRPFAGERWWVLLLLTGAVAVATWAAAVLSNRRDLGAGLLHPRPGPPRAPAPLLRPLGLAVRLHRGAIVGWSVGLLLGGVAYGSIGGDVEDFVGDNEVIADIIAPGGGDLVDAFLGTAVLTLALIATGFALQAVLRLRQEEQTGRAEAVLAASVSRVRWVGTHLQVVVGGTVVVLLASGLGVGATFAVIDDDVSQVPRLVGAALAYAPAILVVAGVTLAAYGVSARAASLGWGFLAVLVLIDFFGELLSLPGWLRSISPFRHTPTLPADDLAVGPLLAVAAVAVALLAVGTGALRRRDIAT